MRCAPWRWVRHLGRVPRRAPPRRRPTSTAFDSLHRGYRADKADPFAFYCEVAAAHRVAHLAARLRLAGRRPGCARARRAMRSTRRCRSTSCTSARGAASDGQFLSYRELAHAARRLLQRPRLHARRADADHRASVLRLVGLPDDRLLRADGALRHAAGLHVPRRSSASARHRRDPRLGAVALPDRRARPARISTARICTSTPIRARAFIPNGTAHLQLRPQRGARVPAVVGACSGSTRYHIDGLRVDARRLDAVSRLRAQGRRVDPEPARRPGEPRGHRLPAHAERGGLSRPPRRAASSPRNRRRGRWCRGPTMPAASASA